jgi:hypothetical protein
MISARRSGEVHSVSRTTPEQTVGLVGLGQGVCLEGLLAEGQISLAAAPGAETKASARGSL